MEQKKFFVSGSLDGILIVWPQYLVTSKKFTQKIKGHVKTITCVQLSLDSNIIITDNHDKTIKIWYRSHLDNQQYYLYQSINEHTKDVYGLSLNEQCNEVISCSEDKTILILEFKKCWTVKQKIKGDGVRLCYFPNNVFVFQPYNQENLEIYYLDTSFYTLNQKMCQLKYLIMDVNHIFQHYITKINKLQSLKTVLTSIYLHIVLNVLIQQNQLIFKKIGYMELLVMMETF